MTVRPAIAKRDLILVLLCALLLAGCAPAHKIEVVNSTDIRVAGFWDGIKHQTHLPGETTVYNFRIGSPEDRETRKHVFEARTTIEGRVVYRWEFTVADLERAGWRIVITDQGLGTPPA